MNVTINMNEEKHGIELIFNEKPNTDTLAALKNNGFRWHRQKKLWYAKNTPERIELANTLSSGSLSDHISGHTEDGYMGAVKWVGNNCKAFYGSDLAKEFRKMFKIYGIKGVTVRAGKATYTDHFTFTVKTTDTDYISLDEYLKDYTVEDLINGRAWIKNTDDSDLFTDEFWNIDGDTQHKILEYNARADYERETSDIQLNYYHIHDYKAFTKDMIEKLDLLHKIILSYNYDDSNSMVDYFDTNFYYDIDIKRIQIYKAVLTAIRTERILP